MSNGSSPSLTKLETIEQAATQALGSINQTLASASASFSALSTSLGSFVIQQAFIPVGATPQVASSGVVGNVSNLTATLTPVSGTMYIWGFDVDTTGAAAGTVKQITLTGPSTNLDFIIAIPTPSTNTAQQFVKYFPFAIPAATSGTAITVTMNGLGSNSNAVINAYGYSR